MCSSEDIFLVDQRPSALVKDYTLEGSAFQLSSGDITYDSVNSVVWSFDNKGGTTYRHSLIYAVNMGTQKKNRGSKKPRKSKLLSSTKGEEYRIKL